MLTDQERYMKEAIRQAKKARALEEVPIGCVIVCNGQIIARGYNRRNTDKNTLSHAELNAIKKASKKLGDWRLEGCFNHKVEVIRGVLQEECSIMLSDFFRELREKKKMLKKSLAEQVGKSEN